MRQLLIEAADYFRDLGRDCICTWRRFFFSPADPLPLGLIRISTGILLLWSLLVLGFDLKDYLGSEGWISPQAVRHYLGEYTPWAWSFWLWVPDRYLVIVWLACLAVAVLYTAGCWSRVTAVLAWAIAVSVVRRAPVTLFGFDLMLSTWLFYLAISGASGQALSIDRLRWTRIYKSSCVRSDAQADVAPATITASLSLRLIQLHLVLIYGCAGLSKLMGKEWWDGEALEMIALTPEFRRFNLTWILQYRGLLQLLTHASVFMEIGYPVLIWVPRLRPLLIAAMAMMHFSIDLFLGLTEFGLAMIAANLAFCSGRWLRRNLFDAEPRNRKSDPDTVDQVRSRVQNSDRLLHSIVSGRPGRSRKSRQDEGTRR